MWKWKPDSLFGDINGLSGGHRRQFGSRETRSTTVAPSFLIQRKHDLEVVRAVHVVKVLPQAGAAAEIVRQSLDLFDQFRWRHRMSISRRRARPSAATWGHAVITRRALARLARVPSSIRNSGHREV